MKKIIIVNEVMSSEINKTFIYTNGYKFSFKNVYKTIYSVWCYNKWYCIKCTRQKSIRQMYIIDKKTI